MNLIYQLLEKLNRVGELINIKIWVYKHIDKLPKM